jgi:hypothetical protein
MAVVKSSEQQTKEDTRGGQREGKSGEKVG